MISILDVLYSLVREFCVFLHNYNYYFGKLAEKPEYPCFLFNMVFNGDNRSNFYTKNTTLDLQIIYFSETNEDDEKYFENKMLVIDKLKEFLSTFNLQVNDRNLKFEYDFGEADGQLTINMLFRFMDGVMIKQEDIDLIENINIATKIQG